MSGRVRQSTRNLYNLTQCALMIMGAWYLPVGHGDSRSHRCTISSRKPRTNVTRDVGKIREAVSLPPELLYIFSYLSLSRNDNLAFSHLPSTMGRVGAAAASAEILKRRKYRNLVEIYVFGSGFRPQTAQPLGVETRNPWVRGVRYSRFFIEFQSFRVSSVQSTRFVTTYDLILSTMNLLKFFISGFTIHYYKKNI